MSVRIKRYGDMTGEACENQYCYDWREIMWIEREVGQKRKENSDSKAEIRAKEADGRNGRK